MGRSRVCTVSVGREEEERLDVYIHGWIKVHSSGRRKGPFAVAVVLPASGVTAKRSKVTRFLIRGERETVATLDGEVNLKNRQWGGKVVAIT